MSWLDDDLIDEPAGPQWHCLGPADKFEEGRSRLAFAGTLKVFVLRIEGQLYATRNSCPHAGASLGHGDVEGKLVTCPRHDWRFNVETGACLTNPIFELTQYPVEIRDGALWVEV